METFQKNLLVCFYVIIIIFTVSLWAIYGKMNKVEKRLGLLDKDIKNVRNEIEKIHQVEYTMEE